MMPDDDLHFSRSGTSHFGKLLRAWRLWPEKGRGRGRKGAAALQASNTSAASAGRR